MNAGLVLKCAGVLASVPGLLFIIVLLLIYFYREAYKRHENFPPGPPRLPIWGSYWLLLWEDYNFLNKALWNMVQRYKTTILGFYLGSYPCVVLTDYEDIRELHARAEFSGRADVIVARERSFGHRHGIIFSDGPDWTEVRRFFLRNIRDFGWGRRFDQSERAMLEEMRDVVELLKGDWRDEDIYKNGQVLISQLFPPYGINAMWSMFGGERLPREHHKHLRHLERLVAKFIRGTDISGGAISLTPWLRYFTPSRFGLNIVNQTNDPLRIFVQESIEEHKMTYDDNHMRDFMDRFLREIKKLSGNDVSEIFNEKQLLLTGVDMVTAASAALSAAVAFMWQQLLHHPEVQANIQKEIDDVVGRDRQPTLDDRQHMPYTEATIRESMRRVAMAPLSIPHVAMEDTTFKGYNIPKGTLMYPHLQAFHMNPDIWGDPENFRPERFMEKDGSLMKKDITLPFGGGKRLCVGETFSRHIMFLFLTHILQSFTLLPTEKLPPLDKVYTGFQMSPVDIWAKVVPR